MLDELSVYIDGAKANDLLSRLEHRNTKTALAAEAELSMLWAISQVAQLTVEPNLSGSSRQPDASSDNILASAGAVVEVRALSDDSFSGKEAMERTANIIASYADQLRKGAGQHLDFEFMDRSYWDNRFHRERCVDPAFNLTPPISHQLTEWITERNWPAPERIRIVEGTTDVVVSWHETTSQHFRVFCRMPPVAYDLEDNPIFKALKKKARQVKGAAPDTLRCVFLVDAGCSLLRRLRPMNGGHEIGGVAIIWHALQKLSIDLVCVFSPSRDERFEFVPESKILWKVTLFDRREGLPANEYDRLNELAAKLPLPRFEGYQARHLHRQGSFSPERRGWYLATELLVGQDEKMTIKISSRLVQEYLAGRMDAATFQRRAFGNGENYFATQLARGNTIQDVRFESGGLDEDDDYLIFDLEFDWGASALKAPRRPPKVPDS